VYANSPIAVADQKEVVHEEKGYLEPFLAAGQVISVRDMTAYQQLTAQEG
jgi:hypothetical protein